MREQPPADAPPPGYVPVCAVGASAGGVGALQTLFRLLPDDLGLAYVVVVHLSPDHPSAMHEILGACTRMPVLQVTDGPALRANCVYVIAPDSELVIEGDNVKSRPFTDPRSRRAPIDMFFRSIAAGRGDGIAVVLTGAGSDGALGVRAIKEGGGIVMVQEPAEAGFPSMPQNAIATGVADVVAPLARLAERIAEAARSKEAVRSLDEDGAANDIRRIVAFLRTRTGHDFSGYKRSTVLRRIQRRMQVCQIANPVEYLQYLRANPEEAKALLSDLLISVTMFFRDPETFIALSHRAIRPLLEARNAGEIEDDLRAWVVGCATGEEAYSLAILLLEEAEQLKVNPPIQIFATDLDEGALATAREGRYPRSIEADVSAERLKRFFVDEGTHYRIDRQVRDLVLFANHSVVREPPFMRLDLITCRNVLIYLERALQQHVNSIFRYGLKADGYLFLGTAETADTSDNHFAVIDRDARIYRALPTRPEFVPTLAAPTAWITGRPALTESRLAVSRLDAGEVLGESHAAALEKSAPPSALVDAEQAVLHLSPSAGRFILLSAGPLSGKLPSIVRPELRLDLKLALDRAFESRRPTITRPIDVDMENDRRWVLLHITPLPAAEGAAPRAVVYFLDSGPGQPQGDEEHAPPPDKLRHLHSELKVAQEAELAGRIRNESAVQELRASNEELQSLNEEYRSTAEELETSKEELQSINEELQTVNAELKSKLGVISAAHNDLKNLTASSEIGTLFLDLDLRIRMFTPRVAELINIADTDVGRSITNFTHRLNYDDIMGDVRRVLRDLTPLENEVRTGEGRWFVVRIRPYQTLDGKVEGAVVTFDDNTERRLAQEALRQSEQIRDLALAAAEMGTWDYDLIADVCHFDARAQELYSLPSSALDHRPEGVAAVVHPDDTGPMFDVIQHASDVDGDGRYDIDYRIARGDGTYRSLRAWGKAEFEGEGAARRAVRIVGASRDVTAEKDAEAALRNSEERFRTMADNAPVLIWETDETGLIFSNAQYSDFFGMDAGNLRGMAWAEFLYPDDAEGYLRAYSDAFAQRRPYVYECRFRRSDGEYRWLRNTGGPLADNRFVGCSLDVTEPMLAKQALHERETDLARVQRIGGIGGLDVDVVNGMASRRSPEYLRLHGLSLDRRDETHAEWRTRVHPDDVEDAERHLFSILEGEALAYTGEYRIIRPCDGAVRWIAARADIERDADGKAVRLVGAHIDITEQKQVQEALRDSEERLRNFGEASQDVLWVRDADTLDWTYLTPAFEEVYGVSRDEALKGDNFRNWLELIVPQDREHARASIDRVVAGELATFEYRIRRPSDGEIRWLRDTDFPMRDEHGRVVGIGGIGQDVTFVKTVEERLTASEQRQQLLIEGVPQLVWRAFDGGQWTWASPQWTEFTGQVEGNSHGYGWLDQVHPDDRERVREVWAGAIERGEYHAEYRIRHAAEQRYRWFQARATPVRNDAGEIVEWLGTSTDVDALRQLQDRQGVLVAELQHRTFNLMGMVRSTADSTIRSSASLEEFKPKFRDRIAALARVQRLLSRATDDDRVSFDELIRGELEAVGALQSDESRVALDGPQGVALRSSTVQTFAMALHELTTNAVKYGALNQPDASLSVRWQIEDGEDGQPWLHMDWRETGVSMPPANGQHGTGQGRTLIEEALPYQLSAKTSYIMTADGVHCSIALPVSTQTTAERDHDPS